MTGLRFFPRNPGFFLTIRFPAEQKILPPAVVVRGDPDCGRSFAVFYLRQEELIAVDAVNRAPEFMMSKQLIAERSRVDPAKLGDERVAMKDVRL